MPASSGALTKCAVSEVVAQAFLPVWFWFPSLRKPHRQECLCYKTAVGAEIRRVRSCSPGSGWRSFGRRTPEAARLRPLVSQHTQDCEVHGIFDNVAEPTARQMKKLPLTVASRSGKPDHHATRSYPRRPRFSRELSV